jgi:hypothetical protein
MSPSWLEKEHCVTRLFPGFDFMRITTDRDVRSDDDQILFFGQSSHPNGVLDIRKKVVSQMDNAMVGRNHLIQSVSELNREVVVEEKLHAASACS